MCKTKEAAEKVYFTGEGWQRKMNIEYDFVGASFMEFELIFAEGWKAALQLSADQKFQNKKAAAINNSN